MNAAMSDLDSSKVRSSTIVIYFNVVVSVAFKSNVSNVCAGGHVCVRVYAQNCVSFECMGGFTAIACVSQCVGVWMYACMHTCMHVRTYRCVCVVCIYT